MLEEKLAKLVYVNLVSRRKLKTNFLFNTPKSYDFEKNYLVNI